MVVMSRIIETPRLTLGPWQASDAAEALEIYSAPSVSRWIPAQLGPFDSAAAMRTTLVRWRDEGRDDEACPGHWAIRTQKDSTLVGGLSFQFAPPGGESLSMAWALAPSAWGNGYAAEAGDALVRWAMHEHDVLDVFAILQPDNTRAAATAQRIGMEWVTELGHLSQGRYQVYRIRHSDLGYED
jgi:RimJ/RimL family protein N-acetyltransferase